MPDTNGSEHYRFRDVATAVRRSRESQNSYNIQTTICQKATVPFQYKKYKMQFPNKGFAQMEISTVGITSNFYNALQINEIHSKVQ